MMYSRTLDASTGRFTITEDEDGALRAWWPDEEHPAPRTEHSSPRLDALAPRIIAALAGAPIDFSDVPLPSGPPFHRRCWEVIRAVPAGRTITYADLAERAGGSASACRAAGGAMRHNPLPVIIPCHRVVGATGPGGFAGTSRRDDPRVLRKLRLLELEAERRSGRYPAGTLQPAAAGA